MDQPVVVEAIPNCMNWLRTHIAPRRPITPNRITKRGTSNQNSRWNTPQEFSDNRRKRIKNLAC
jgi:hypothetical protein